MELKLGLTLGVKLTQQENRKKYKEKARAHFLGILDFGICLLLLLSIQFEGFAVTKPCEQLSGEIPTHLVPSLVLGMKYSTHTILHSSQIHLSTHERSRAILFRNFQQGRTIT
jgi:hypothetical protein